MSKTEIIVPRLEIVRPPSRRSFHPREVEEEAQQRTDNLHHIGDIDRIKIYASESLINEVETIRDLGGLAVGNVYHATSSVALPGISRQRALLSSKQLTEMTEPIVTGEITTDMGELHRHWGGLEDVYASNSPVSLTYAKTVGNDEYPVIFGINKNAIEDKPLQGIDSGDGIRLGPRVDLKHVTAQIVPYEKVPEMQAWSATNNNDRALTMSLDAAFVLSHLGNRISRYTPRNDH